MFVFSELLIHINTSDLYTKICPLTYSIYSVSHLPEGQNLFTEDYMPMSPHLIENYSRVQWAPTNSLLPGVGTWWLKDQGSVALKTCWKVVPVWNNNRVEIDALFQPVDFNRLLSERFHVTLSVWDQLRLARGGSSQSVRNMNKRMRETRFGFGVESVNSTL